MKCWIASSSVRRWHAALVVALITTGLWLFFPSVVGAAPQDSAGARSEQKGPVQGVTQAQTATTPQESLDAQEKSTQDKKAEQAAREEIERRRERADQIADLLRGRLDPQVAAESLFEFSLDGPLPPAFLEETDTEPPRDARAAADEDPLGQILSRFRRLNERTRKALLAAHEKKHQAFVAEEKEREKEKQRLEQERQRAAQLAAYLEGKLDPRVDVEPLLSINLLRVWEANESEGGSSNSNSGSSSSNSGSSSSDSSSPKKKAEKEASQQEQKPNLAALLRRYAALRPEEKKRLEELHHQNREKQQLALEEQNSEEAIARSAAETAAEQRKQALLAAKQARTEMARVIAEEKARLLGLQEEQANVVSRLAQARKQAVQSREASLAWTRKVRELRMSSPFAKGREERAAAYYEDLVGELTRERQELRNAITQANSEPQVVGPGKAVELPETPETRELDALRAQLEQEQERLKRELSSWRLERASTLRTVVVEENKARLSLVDLLSPDLRSKKLGFGPEGIAQATREVSQIELEARYHLLQVQTGMGSALSRLASQPLLLLLVTVKLVALTFAFRLWRRRAHGLLSEIMAWGTSRGAGPGGQAAATFAWYLDRTRQPLEWLLYLTTFLSIARQLGDLPESQYLRELVMWLCIGSFATMLIDAVAARQATQDDHAQLRYRSLRLVGLTLVVVILLLRLARLSVGTGTLYSWITTASWPLVLPVLIVLIRWWRPTVLEMAKNHHEPSKVLRWAASRQQGLSSYLATAFAGAQLFYEGLYRFFLQRAAHMQTTQRLLAYLFRRELEKRSTSGDEAYLPLSEQQAESFHRALHEHDLIESYGSHQLDVVRSIAEGESNSVVALVGERGLGKTTFLKRVTDDFEPEEVIGVTCGPRGYGALLGELRDSLGLVAGAPRQEMVDVLRKRNPKVVWIDDAHHLIRPLIGGLRDFDQLAGLAHEVGGRTCWLMAVRIPSWNYLQRARGDRAVVDSIVHLPPWTETELVELTRKCAETAQISPCYDDLVVPRQIDVSAYGSSTEHTERDYVRILWDFSDGNPMVALHFFWHSLRRKDDHVHVRLFTPPSTSSLEELPTSIYFVLRSVIQLGLAVESDVVRCTGLSPSDVADALRLAKGRKYIEKQGNRFFISIHWYRTITQMLRRQHLLIG